MIGISETTANVYVKLVGEKDETPRIPIQNKTTLEVEFECNNLGRLVVLAIGIW
jgi:fucose permease